MPSRSSSRRDQRQLRSGESRAPHSADRVALVTGGTSGIGLESAIALLEGNIRLVIINGREEQRGLAACRAIAKRVSRGRAIFIAADVSTIEGSRALAAAAKVHAAGGIDVLVNCAGGDTVPELFHRMPITDIETTVRGWLFATMYACHSMMPQLREAAAIINVASDAGKSATPGESVIGAAMSAIAMFSRTLAMEAKRNRIRVNVVTPSFVRGTRTGARVTAEGMGAKLFARAQAAAHLGLPEPKDVANLVAFLAGPGAAYITGQTVSINGGISAV